MVKVIEFVYYHRNIRIILIWLFKTLPVLYSIKTYYKHVNIKLWYNLEAECYYLNLWIDNKYI